MPGGAVNRWTVMLYLAGADDLEAHMTRALLALEEVGPPEGVEVVVQLTRAPLEAVQRFLPERVATGIDGDWSGTRRYRLRRRPGGAPGQPVIASDLLADLGEVSPSCPTLLRDFVQFARDRFPAERELLVLSGHGMGFVGVALDVAFCPHPAVMSLRAMAVALRTAGRPPDLLLLDACQMNGLEVACELSLPRPAATWLVTPASKAPRAGLDYVAALRVLDGKVPTGTVAAELARVLEPSARVQVLAFRLDPNRWRTVGEAARGADNPRHMPMFRQAASTVVHPSPGTALRLLVSWPNSLDFPERYHYLYRRLRFTRLSRWHRLLPPSERSGWQGETLDPLPVPSPVLKAWLAQTRRDLTEHQVELLMAQLGWHDQ